MKKLFNTKFLSAILAIMLALSMASCAAMGESLPNEDGGLDLFPELNDPNYSAPTVNGNGNVQGGNAANKDEALEGGATEGEMEAGDVEVDLEGATPDVPELDVPETKPPVFVENPFINTADQNTSTFSADVDTASYTYFRKLAQKGYNFQNLKNSGSQFRTEEFINYFRYDVAGPKENELFGVYTELSPCPWNAETMLFRVTLQAEEAVNEGGNNLVFLIDVSGSMSSQDKLPLLKTAFSYLVSNLGANDTVSIVTYSGREAVVLDGCNGLDTDAIMNAINSLRASGSTNGQAGLTMAYQIAEKHFKPEGNNRIIMASDGDLNVGISSTQELTSYIEEKRDQGVYLSVLGFGTGNYKDEKMEALADNGNGVYYYIDGETEAEKVFGTDLVGTLYTVAEDVKLQLEFNSQRVESYRLIGYENRKLANEDFENDKKDAGEVGASHQVTVCYEIKPRVIGPDEDIIDAPMITLRVRYKNPGEDLSLLNEYMIGGVVSDMSDDQKFICAVIETCMLLHGSEYAEDITLEGIVEDLEALDLEGDSYKAEFREIIRNFVK